MQLQALLRKYAKTSQYTKWIAGALTRQGGSLSGKTSKSSNSSYVSEKISKQFSFYTIAHRITPIFKQYYSQNISNIVLAINLQSKNHTTRIPYFFSTRSIILQYWMECYPRCLYNCAYHSVYLELDCVPK